MTYLLDSHAMLWWWTDPSRLSPRALATMADPGNVLLVSAASAYEILYKAKIGKLSLPVDLRENFAAAVQQEGWQALPLSLLHAELAAFDAAEHRDPFDRILAAQSRAENAPIITCDPLLGTFPIKTVW